LGQKTNPIGFRIGFNKDWESIWFANRRNEYVKTFYEDLRIKDYLNKRLSDAMISKIVILRKSDKLTIVIHTARPGLVIGKKGVEIEKVKQELITLLHMNTQDDYSKLAIDVQEVKKPELDAHIVGMDIARQIENRISYRRAMKRAIERTMSAGAEGIKIKASGRLHGAEIARSEEYKDGRTPLHTLRSDIDYAISEAHTRYGIIGIKVWICRGELMQKEHQQS